MTEIVELVQPGGSVTNLKLIPGEFTSSGKHKHAEDDQKSSHACDHTESFAQTDLQCDD